MAPRLTPSNSLAGLRCVATEALQEFQRRSGAVPRPDQPLIEDFAPRMIATNHAAFALSYALFSCYPDVKGIVAELPGFDLRRFGLEPAALRNMDSLTARQVQWVRRILSGFRRDQERASRALLNHIAQIRRDRLLGPATPGRLACVREATGRALRALSPEDAARYVLGLKRVVIAQLDRQGDRLRRNGRSCAAVDAMTQRIREETAAPPCSEIAGEFADDSEVAETIKDLYVRNPRTFRPCLPERDDIGHFCRVFADEIADVFDRDRDRGGPSVKTKDQDRARVAFAPRDEAFLELGSRFGDCSARRPRPSADGNAINLHWTTHSWALHPFYRVIIVFCGGEPVLKGHVLPLLARDRPVLALDAVEFVPQLRDKNEGQANPFRSERLRERRSEFLDALFAAVRGLARRLGAEAVLVERFSNCAWLRTALENLPSEAHRVRHLVVPFENEPIRFLIRELLGPAYEELGVDMEVQARNHQLMDQGLRPGWKEFGILDGAGSGDDLPLRGP